MATSPWAVARPFSYLVSPLAVISIGCFSVPAWPNAAAQAQNNPKTVKTSLRIVGCEVTEAPAPCKGKTASAIEATATQPKSATSLEQLRASLAGFRTRSLGRKSESGDLLIKTAS